MNTTPLLPPLPTPDAPPNLRRLNDEARSLLLCPYFLPAVFVAGRLWGHLWDAATHWGQWLASVAPW